MKTVKSNTDRPLSWCVDALPVQNSEKDEKSKNICRGILVRSTSFQALHSALATLYRVDDFHLERIGQGFFSEVFKAHHRVTGQLMVLKMNKLSSNRHNMLREVELMNRLHHPNILSYYGVCVHEGQLHALTEYINGGSLDCLLQNGHIDLPWTTRVSLTLDIAKGMDYLHCKNVMHRDLTSKNIFIKHAPDNKYLAVIGDFGLATTGPKDRCVRLRQVGSPYWMAPEVIRGEWYDHRVDVFSFGIIVCEVIARCEADPDILPRTNNFGIHYLAFSKMCQNDCPPFFLETAFQCCQIDPDSRPSFYELSRKLEKLLNYLQAIAEHRHRKHKAHHRRSFSDESISKISGVDYIGTPRSEIAASPQEVLERISAADPYFQPSSATVNPFSQVKLPAKSQLIVDDGGRFCQSMPDLRKLHLFRPIGVSLSQIASSEMCLNRCSDARKHKSCRCDNIKSKKSHEYYQRFAFREDGTVAFSARCDHHYSIRRRGSGESGFFSVDDVERMSTPELCLSFSELSTASAVSNDDEETFFSPILGHRSSSVVTDSSEDMSSLSYDWDRGPKEDDKSNDHQRTDIKAIVEFFERGYGSKRPADNARRSVVHRKERLVPSLRNKFCRPLNSSQGSPQSKHLLNSIAQCNFTSKSYYTKEKASGRQRQFSPLDRKDLLRERPKFYITEGTVRAKRTIFESN